MLNNEEIQQKYMQFQILQQQMQQITEQVELLHQQNFDLDISKNALLEISKTEIDAEILAPVANGIFFRSALKDNHKLILNVGSNITVEKTIPETMELLSKQQQEIIARIAEAEKALQELNNQAIKMYQEMKTYTEKS